MVIREVLEEEKDKYNMVVTHPLQSWAWGEFKASTGLEVVRLAAFNGPNLVKGYQFTIHKIPYLNWKIGYLPKSYLPDETLMYAVRTAAKKYGLVFIKIEPNIYAPAETAESDLKEVRSFLESHDCQVGRAMFTPHSFVLDISKSEVELLTNLKQKTRYNIKMAQKHGVQVEIDNSEEAFEEYLRLWKQTTKRQAFFSHNTTYHQRMWQTMKTDRIAHLIKATYQNKILGVWILFIHNNVLYYPYGASSRQHREVMANNLLAWESIRFGKQNFCHSFDMWGSLGQNPDQTDPWYGFHKFKEGYGGKLVQFVGTYDFVADPHQYQVFTILDTWRWKLLRLRTKLPF